MNISKKIHTVPSCANQSEPCTTTTDTNIRNHVKLHRDVRALCTEACHLLGLEITKQATEVIAELVYKKISVYGSDLEAFAFHAKRNTIKPEDVKLLARRNPSLKAHLDKIVTTNPTSSTDKKRKTMVPVTKQCETPIANPKTIASDKGNCLKPKGGENIEKMAVDDTIDLTFE